MVREKLENCKEKRQNTAAAWSVRIWVILVRIFPHSNWIGRDTPYVSCSVQMRGNADQNNSEYVHSVRSVQN